MITLLLLFCLSFFSIFAQYDNELDDLLRESKLDSNSNDGLEEIGTDFGDMREFETSKKTVDLDDLLDELDNETPVTKQPSQTPLIAQPERKSKSAPVVQDVYEEEYEEYEEELEIEGDARIARFYKNKQRISDEEWKELIGYSFEEIYIIAEGDTLWGISEKFLDSPWYWPKIWELNSYITNPHLIYPGNQIKFSFNVDEGPSIMLVKGDAQKELKESVEKDYTILERQIQPSEFDKLGFHKESLSKTTSRTKPLSIIEGGKIIMGESPLYSGEIYAARTSRTVLLPTDMVEVNLNSSDCTKGEKHIAIEHVSGSVYNVAGELIVTGKTNYKNRCLAKIYKIYSGVYRGIKLSTPLLSMYAPVKNENATMTGKITGFDFKEKKMAGDGDRFFVRFNTNQAPMPGTLLYLYEIKDPNTNKQIDPFIVGVAKLIHSSGQYATADIIASSKTITERSTVTTRF